MIWSITFAMVFIFLVVCLIVDSKKKIPKMQKAEWSDELLAEYKSQWRSVLRWSLLLIVAVLYGITAYTYREKLYKHQQTIVTQEAAELSHDLFKSIPESAYLPRAQADMLIRGSLSPALSNVEIDVLCSNPSELSLSIINSTLGANGVYVTGEPTDSAFHLNINSDKTKYNRRDQTLWASISHLLDKIQQEDKWAYEYWFSCHNQKLRQLVMNMAELQTQNGGATFDEKKLDQATIDLFVQERYRLLDAILRDLQDYRQPDHIDILAEQIARLQEETGLCKYACAQDVLCENEHGSSPFQFYLQELAHNTDSFDTLIDTLFTRYLAEMKSLSSASESSISDAQDKIDKLTRRHERRVALRRNWLSPISLLRAIVISMTDVYRNGNGEKVEKVVNGEKVVKRMKDLLAPVMELLPALIYLCLGYLAFVFNKKIKYYILYRMEAERDLHELRTHQITSRFFTPGIEIPELCTSVRDYLYKIACKLNSGDFQSIHENCLIQYDAAVEGQKANIREVYVWMIRLGIIGTLLGIGQAFHEMTQGFATGYEGAAFKNALIGSINGNAVAVWTSLAAHVITLILEYMTGMYIFSRCNPMDSFFAAYQNLLNLRGTSALDTQVARFEHTVRKLKFWVNSVSNRLSVNDVYSFSKELRAADIHLHQFTRSLVSSQLANKFYTSGRTVAEFSRKLDELHKALEIKPEDIRNTGRSIKNLNVHLGRVNVTLRDIQASDLGRKISEVIKQLNRRLTELMGAAVALTESFNHASLGVSNAAGKMDDAGSAAETFYTQATSLADVCSSMSSHLVELAQILPEKDEIENCRVAMQDSCTAFAKYNKELKELKPETLREMIRLINAMQKAFGSFQNAMQSALASAATPARDSEPPSDEE